MQPLFELTLRTIREDIEEVALNAMEFWSSLCDEEVSCHRAYYHQCRTVSPSLAPDLRFFSRGWWLWQRRAPCFVRVG